MLIGSACPNIMYKQMFLHGEDKKPEWHACILKFRLFTGINETFPCFGKKAHFNSACLLSGLFVFSTTQRGSL